MKNKTKADAPYIGEYHPSLPPGLTQSQLELWLQNNSVERFTHEKKDFFEPEEIQAFEHESSVAGREWNRLTDMLKEASTLVKKGTEEAVTFTIPVTKGTKMLETVRRENDDFIESGYNVQKVEIYGVPNMDTHFMEYFDAHGNEITERKRTLSPKEKNEYLGMFQNIKNGIDQTTGEIINPGKTGTNG